MIFSCTITLQTAVQVYVWKYVIHLQNGGALWGLNSVVSWGDEIYLKCLEPFQRYPPPFVSQRVSLSFILTTGRLTSRDLHAHSHRRWCRKMRGLFCKSDKYTCQGSNAPVYCLPVLPLGKKKNNLLLINKGHWRVCRATWQLALPLLTDTFCVQGFMGRETWQAFNVWYIWWV